MWVYFTILALLLALWFISTKTEQVLLKKINYLSLIVSFLVLVAVMTLRFDIGFDYWSYNSIYKECAAQPFAQTMSVHWKEAGFFLLTTLLAKLGVSYHVYLLFCNLVMLGCVLFVSFRYSKNWYLSTFIFVTLHFMAHCMNFLRQSMAACIAFLGWKYLKEGSFLKYSLVILVAATFHISVLVMIPAYFLLRLPFTTIPLCIVSGSFFLAYLLFDKVVYWAVKLELPYTHYINTIFMQRGDLGAMIFPLILLIFSVCFCKKLLAKDKSNSILLYAVIYNFMIYAFFTKMFIIERFAIYLFIYTLLLLPEIIALFDAETVATGTKNGAVNKKEKAFNRQRQDTQIIVTFCIIVGCLGYFLYGASNGYHKAYPYVSIWEPDKIIANEDYLMKSSHL